MYMLFEPDSLSQKTKPTNTELSESRCVLLNESSGALFANDAVADPSLIDRSAVGLIKVGVVVGDSAEATVGEMVGAPLPH
jgi:hypothetical protein